MRALSILLAPALMHAAGGPRQGLAHFYYVDDAAAWQSLEQNAASIDLLSPVWIEVRTGGEVRTSVDDRVVRLAGAAGFELMPVVMNQDFRPEIAREVLGDDRKRTALAMKLARFALVEGFRGLQLDFENLEEADRDGYSKLAEQLGSALRRGGRQLSVAVAAPVYSTGPVNAPPVSWQPTPRSAAFDYERLAAAADFLTLMAYDQYATPDAPGPVAGLPWVEACVRHLLERVPAEKVTLGVPLYHRHWAGARVTTGAWAEAQAAAIRANVASLFDRLHQESVIRYEDSSPHVIWLHDARSVALRRDLAARYGLRGFSAWRLGQEDPAVWPRLFPPGKDAAR